MKLRPSTPRPSCRTRLIAALALLGAAALPGTPARAERLLWIYGERVTTRTLHDPDLGGGGVGFRFFSHGVVSFQLQYDMTAARNQGYNAFTFGPCLGSTRGRVRPWFEITTGFSMGSQPWTGYVGGYGAGATVDVTPRAGAIVQVRGMSSGNFEYDEHLVEFRAGAFARFGVPR